MLMQLLESRIAEAGQLGIVLKLQPKPATFFHHGNLAQISGPQVLGSESRNKNGGVHERILIATGIVKKILVWLALYWVS